MFLYYEDWDNTFLSDYTVSYPTGQHFHILHLEILTSIRKLQNFLLGSSYVLPPTDSKALGWWTLLPVGDNALWSDVDYCKQWNRNETSALFYYWLRGNMTTANCDLLRVVAPCSCLNAPLRLVAKHNRAGSDDTSPLQISFTNLCTDIAKYLPVSLTAGWPASWGEGRGTEGTPPSHTAIGKSPIFSCASPCPLHLLFSFPVLMWRSWGSEIFYLECTPYRVSNPAGIICYLQGLPVRTMTMLADDAMFIAPLCCNLSRSVKKRNGYKSHSLLNKGIQWRYVLVVINQQFWMLIVWVRWQLSSELTRQTHIPVTSLWSCPRSVVN